MSEIKMKPDEPSEGKPIGYVSVRERGLVQAIQERGVLNAMMDYPAKQYEATHPGMVCRWEYAPPNGDNMMVVGKEALGYHVVDASEIAGATPSQQKKGPVRCGDMVLMAGPKEIRDALLAEDARKAEEDVRAPERTYYDAVTRKQVRLTSGEVTSAQPTGTIRRTVEVKEVDTSGE